MMDLQLINILCTLIELHVPSSFINLREVIETINILTDFIVQGLFIVLNFTLWKWTFPFVLIHVLYQVIVFFSF